MAWWPHTQQVSVKKGSAHHNQWKTGFYSKGVLYFHKAIQYYWNQARGKIIFISACFPKCSPSSNPCSTSTLRQQVSNCPYAAIYGLKQRWRSSGRKITFQEFKFIFWGCCMSLDSARRGHLVPILVGNNHIFFLDQHLLYGILHRHSEGFVMPFLPRRQTPLYNLSLNITNVHFIVTFCYV